MGEEQPQGQQFGTGAQQPASSGQGGFWRSLPGILTAAATFLTALAGLAAVVVPNLNKSSPADAARSAINSASADTAPPAINASSANATPPAIGASPTAPPPTATASPPAEPAPRATTPPPADPAPQSFSSAPPAPIPLASQLFIAKNTSDGFVVLRSGPTTNSEEITRILGGDGVRCGAARLNEIGQPWRHCKDGEGHVGFILARLLQES